MSKPTITPLKPGLENRLGLQWHESTIEKKIFFWLLNFTQAKLTPTTRKQSTQWARRFVIVCHSIRTNGKDGLQSCKSGKVVKCNDQKQKQTAERQCLSS